jgi:hypothetical protein
VNGNDNPLLFLIVFAAAAFWLIRVNMDAIDRRSRSIESLARSGGLAFSSTDPFELATLPFEIIGVRGGVAVTNVIYGMRSRVPVIGFDLRHLVSVGESSTLQFSCAMTSLEITAPPVVIARRVVDQRRLGAVVGGAAGIVTESGEFDRAFVVRCDDRRFALAVLDPTLMGWLQDVRGAWSFELAGSRLLCYSPSRNPADLSALFDALVGFRQRIPSLAADHAQPARPDPLFVRVSELAPVPRAHRPMRVSSIVIAVVGVVGLLVLVVVAFVALLMSSSMTLP